MDLTSEMTFNDPD